MKIFLELEHVSEFLLQWLLFLVIFFLKTSPKKALQRERKIDATHNFVFGLCFI